MGGVEGEGGEVCMEGEGGGNCMYYMYNLQLYMHEPHRIYETSDFNLELLTPEFHLGIWQLSRSKVDPGNF